MATTTTNLGLPKPEGTDRLRDGWDAIADLADALDLYLSERAGRRWFKAADTSRAGGSGYSADVHLTGMLLPAGEWEISAYLGWTASTNAVDVRTYWSVAAGVTLADRWCLGPATAATDESAASPMVASVRAYNEAVGFGIGAVAFPTATRETFRATATALAAFNLIWAPIAGSGSAALKAGSFVSARRIA